MKMDMNPAVQEFIAANSRITQSYFAFTEKVLALVSNSPNQQQVLLQLLAQTESVTQTFLAAHQQLLAGEASQLAAVTPPLNFGAAETPAVLPVPAQPAVAQAPAEESHEAWLRRQLAEMTGFPAADIDLTQEFEQLGLDSLGRQDVQEALLQRYPRAGKAALFDAATPSALLAGLAEPAAEQRETPAPAFCVEQVMRRIVADLTGFAPSDIDLTLTFDELGLDSLGRLDVLEALQSERPELKAHAPQFTNLQTPGAMIALLEEKLSAEPMLEAALLQLLKKLGTANDGDINLETPFDRYLTDGFTQSSVWENLSPQHDICHFAGEALMSRRNAGEALALLNRLG